MELIKVTEKNGEQLVSARDLHEFLEVKKDFSDWIKTYANNSDYGFEEGFDYTTFKGNSTESTPRPRIEYILKMDMAKELCMLSKVEKGRQARKYFIECEKKLREISTKQLPTTYKEALLELIKVEEEKEKLQLELTATTTKITKDAPLVEFATKVANSSDSIDVGDFAKVLSSENIKLGRTKLFAWLRENKYVMTNNIPYQKYVDNKFFEVIEVVKTTPWGDKVFAKTLITGKGQIYLVQKLKDLGL